MTARSWRTRLRELAIDRGGLIAVATLALYIVLAPTYVVDGDNAELATLAVTPGPAHPSGYPLYVLWLRATAWLPGASAAHTAAIATCILGGAMAFALHAACRAWGARPWAASVAVAIYVAAPEALRLGTQAEVFALNGLLAAAILLIAAPDGPRRGTARVALLALVAGLGLANHLTCALLAPVGIWGVVRGLREAGPAKLRTAVIAAVAFAAGLSPYLYYLASSDGPMAWRPIAGLGDLVDMIARNDYGGSARFATHGAAVTLGANVGELGLTLARTWLWLPLAFGVGALVHRCVRGPHRVAWITLAATVVLAGPVLVARFNIPYDPIGRYVVQRFHLLPALVLAIPVAVGLSAIGARLVERAGLPERGPAVTVIATVVVLAGATTLSYPWLARAHSPALDRELANIVGPLPHDAVIIAGSDALYFGLGYTRYAEGRRPDVVHVDLRMMGYPWYRARTADRLGFDPLPVGDEPASVRLARAVLAHGRPLFVQVDADQQRILGALPSYPYGVLVRVLAPGDPMPSLDTIVEDNRALYAGFDLDYPRPSADDDWPAYIHRRYADTWTVLARALEASGNPAAARDAAAVAASLAPRP